MDMIDIFLARAMTPQAQIDTYAARAEKAVRDATTAVNNITSITEQTNANNTAAETALNTVNTALESLESDTLDLVDNEMKKLAVNLTTVNNQDNSISKNFVITYPDDSNQTLNNVVKYYSTTGNNTDGTMTQKAITAAINNIQIPSTNLGSQNANKIVIVGPDGTIVPSTTVSEASIINGTHSGGGGDTPYVPPISSNTGIVGLKINYSTATMTPTDDAINATTEDFNQFRMYGGRMRCMVDNDGVIEAFYGDSNYDDTPGNGYQIMVYQPKFYYKRTPLATETNQYGTVIKEEIIQLSDIARSGYKLHPLFINEDGEELEYALLSAYEGSIQSEEQNSYQDIAYTNFLNCKLSSVSNAKPISGINNSLTITNAQHLANNRSEGWHINNSKALSAQQMLFIVEFGQINTQKALGNGIISISGSSSTLLSANTGATKNLGNASGSAETTVFVYNNEMHVNDAAENQAISYRGYQNPWGNMWDYIGDILIQNISSERHIPYVCKNFDYSTTISNDYVALNCRMPSPSGWISGFHYSSEYDWIYLPIECRSNANSVVPIGDYYWGSYAESGTQSCINGGAWYGKNNNGLFYYAIDRSITYTRVTNANARLLFIPHDKNNIYINNIQKWNAKIGG